MTEAIRGWRASLAASTAGRGLRPKQLEIQDRRYNDQIAEVRLTGELVGYRYLEIHPYRVNDSKIPEEFYDWMLVWWPPTEGDFPYEEGLASDTHSLLSELDGGHFLLRAMDYHLAWLAVEQRRFIRSRVFGDANAEDP